MKQNVFSVLVVTKENISPATLCATEKGDTTNTYLITSNSIICKPFTNEKTNILFREDSFLIKD